MHFGNTPNHYPNTTSKKIKYRHTYDRFRRHVSNEEQKPNNQPLDQDEARNGFFVIFLK